MVIAKFLGSKLSGHLAWIQATAIIGGAIWLLWQGYDLCKAGQDAALAEDQAAQIRNEIALSKEIERLKQEVASDEGTDIHAVWRTIERLHERRGE